MSYRLSYLYVRDRKTVGLGFSEGMKRRRTYHQVFLRIASDSILRVASNATRCPTICHNRQYNRRSWPGGVPSGFARQDCRSVPEGCFPATPPSLVPGNLSGGHSGQASRSVSTGRSGVMQNRGVAAGTHGPPHPLPVPVGKVGSD